MHSFQGFDDDTRIVETLVHRGRAQRQTQKGIDGNLRRTDRILYREDHVIRMFAILTEKCKIG